MDNPHTFFNPSFSTKKLRVDKITLSDLERHLILRFGSFISAGRIAGITEGRVRQLCSGIDLPKSPDIIKRLSESWGLDVVVLTMLFERGDSNAT